MDKNDTAFARAVAFHNAGKIQEAVAAYDAVLYGPNGSDPFVQYAIGSLFAQAQQFGYSIDFLSRSVKGQPNNFEAWSNLGLAYRSVGRVEEAVKCHETALTLPLTAEQKANVLTNLSGCYVNEGNPQRAIDLADQGLALKDMPQLHNHRALGLLELGEYKAGFAEYEHRVRLPEFTPRDYGDIPRWDGNPVGKLAVHGEQGLGDELLFLTNLSRILFPFDKDAKTLAKEIHVECAARLVGVLRHSFKGYPNVFFYPDHVALMSKVKPDAWLPMGSIYHTTRGWTRWKYLNSSRAYQKGEKRRVGLSWRGGTMKTHEYHRNTRLEDWRVLVDAIRAEGAEPISIQYGPAKEMAQELGIEHDESSIRDLDTLTGMVQSCDLVVSVCNTTIHQAGASGTPCLVLVPSKPAWRYGIQGERSDWYDSVAYERQAMGEPWSLVMLRVVPRVRRFLTGGEL